jgi:hypothetical protein
VQRKPIIAQYRLSKPISGKFGKISQLENRYFLLEISANFSIVVKGKFKTNNEKISIHVEVHFESYVPCLQDYITFEYPFFVTLCTVQYINFRSTKFQRSNFEMLLLLVHGY